MGGAGAGVGAARQESMSAIRARRRRKGQLASRVKSVCNAAVHASECGHGTLRPSGYCCSRMPGNNSQPCTHARFRVCLRAALHLGEGDDGGRAGQGGEDGVQGVVEDAALDGSVVLLALERNTCTAAARHALSETLLGTHRAWAAGWGSECPAAAGARRAGGCAWRATWRCLEAPLRICQGALATPGAAATAAAEPKAQSAHLHEHAAALLGRLRTAAAAPACGWLGWGWGVTPRQRVRRHRLST